LRGWCVCVGVVCIHSYEKQLLRGGGGGKEDSVCAVCTCAVCRVCAVCVCVRMCACVCVCVRMCACVYMCCASVWAATRCRWMAKNSSARKRSRILGDLAMHTNSRISGGRNAIRLEYYDALQLRFNSYLQNEEGAPAAIEMLDACVPVLALFIPSFILWEGGCWARALAAY
jgi:hypothetical protein